MKEGVYQHLHLFHAFGREVSTCPPLNHILGPLSELESLALWQWLGWSRACGTLEQDSCLYDLFSTRVNEKLSKCPIRDLAIWKERKQWGLDMSVKATWKLSLNMGGQMGQHKGPEAFIHTYARETKEKAGALARNRTLYVSGDKQEPLKTTYTKKHHAHLGETGEEHNRRRNNRK